MILEEMFLSSRNRRHLVLETSKVTRKKMDQNRNYRRLQRGNLTRIPETESQFQIWLIGREKYSNVHAPSEGSCSMIPKFNYFHYCNSYLHQTNKFVKQKPMRFSMVWQAKCSNIQFVYFYLYFCIMYSTIRLTFNALFNIQLRIQHSTILFIFNSSFIHSIIYSTISTIYSTFNLNF